MASRLGFVTETFTNENPVFIKTHPNLRKPLGAGIKFILLCLRVVGGRPIKPSYIPSLSIYFLTR